MNEDHLKEETGPETAMERKEGLAEEVKEKLEETETKIEQKMESAAECGQRIIHGLCSAAGKEAEKCTNSLRHGVIRDGMRCGCGCEADYCLCQEIFPWIGFVSITFASGWISSLFMQPQGFEWFATLTRPTWAPPQWIFLPVWMLLYFLLGTSVWLSWRKLGCLKAGGILVLYGLLLLLQIGWTYMFFYSQNPFGAFIDMIWVFAVLILLWLATLPVCRLAAGLLIPQILWILYALVLNYHLWRLN